MDSAATKIIQTANGGSGTARGEEDVRKRESTESRTITVTQGLDLPVRDGEAMRVLPDSTQTEENGTTD